MGVRKLYWNNDNVGYQNTNTINLYGRLNNQSVEEVEVDRMIARYLNNLPVNNWDIYSGDDPATAAVEKGVLVIDKLNPEYPDNPNEP